MHPKHYHIFNLPPELLQTLTLRNLLNHQSLPTKSDPPSDSQVELTNNPSGSRACNICLDVSFANVDEQRRHFRSDWHRYNVKVRLNGGQSVAEAAFNSMVDGECVS
jgi:hypothetical protein